MKIIVGLGNPGKKYEKTRHNVGFNALDALASDLSLGWLENKKNDCFYAKNEEFLLIKPMSFMNNSGKALRYFLDYHKLLPKKFGMILSSGNDFSEKIIIIHDDLDIDLGKYKISINSRSAGHNGIESIINHLKTKNFKRVRIGIRTEDLGRIPRKNFVLQNFSESESSQIDNILDDIVVKIKNSSF